MASDPVQRLSGQYTKEILTILRIERDDLHRRIRNNYTAGESDEEMEVTIFGTGKITLDKLKECVSRYGEKLYLDSISRAITDVATMDLYSPTQVPAHITKTDQQNATQETAYTMSLLNTTISLRNEAIKKILTQKGKGITRLQEEVTGVINRVWIPRLETDFRIGMNHAWNAGAYTRISEYAAFKRWDSSCDHDVMDGVTIPANESFKVPPFKVDGDLVGTIPECEMFYPGDVSGNPDRRHLEGCFCRLVPVKEIDEIPGPEPVKRGREKKEDSA